MQHTETQTSHEVIQEPKGKYLSQELLTNAPTDKGVDTLAKWLNQHLVADVQKNLPSILLKEFAQRQTFENPSHNEINGQIPDTIRSFIDFVVKDYALVLGKMLQEYVEQKANEYDWRHDTFAANIDFPTLEAEEQAKQDVRTTVEHFKWRLYGMRELFSVTALLPDQIGIDALFNKASAVSIPQTSSV